MASTTIDKLVPGIAMFRNYKREWLSADLIAGLSVAAVALPIGIAYAQLAGFPPVVGIYSCILPPVAYALFGSSRQLIVNPDAAACAIVASTVAPLAVGNPEQYLDLAIALTLMTGVLCIAGGLAGLGAIANFLSRPILTGYLNGIALSIIVGQLGKLLGFDVISGGFFRTFAAVVSRINETHVATAVVGISLLALLFAMKFFLPHLPGPLIAALIGVAVIYSLGLSTQGVAIVGAVPAGFPTPRVPSVDLDQVGSLLFGAGGIVLVSFCSMMTTARGFAAKNGYAIDANRDMVALGISDIASALNRGFVVSGADSRTAVADSSGGKTQMTGIVAAVAMAFVLMFLTSPLAYLPITALAAILIASASGLFDLRSVRRYYNLSMPEFRHCIVATLGVMTVGVLPGVLIAVVLAMFNLIRKASRPNNAVLGRISGTSDVYGELEAGGQALPGLIIFRFDSSILFFNAEYFAGRVRTLIREAPTQIEYFLLDAESSASVDITGVDTLESLQNELLDQGIFFGIARAKGRFLVMLEDSGMARNIGTENMFATVHQGANAFLAGLAQKPKGPKESVRQEQTA